MGVVVVVVVVVSHGGGDCGGVLQPWVHEVHRGVLSLHVVGVVEAWVLIIGHGAVELDGGRRGDALGQAVVQEGLRGGGLLLLNLLLLRRLLLLLLL